MDSLLLNFKLETNERIWSHKIWTFFVRASVNGMDIIEKIHPQVICTERNSHTEHVNLDHIMKGQTNLELNVKITMEVIPNLTQIPIEKFIDTIFQSKKIISNNKSILNESKYSDFTFIVQGREFKVHKNILGAASPVFDRLFSARLLESVTNECHIEDIDPVIFSYMLTFIYCGELPEKLHEGNIARELFKASHYYQIDELVETCTFMESYALKVDNALDIYEFALTYNLENLISNAWEIIKL